MSRTLRFLLMFSLCLGFVLAATSSPFSGKSFASELTGSERHLAISSNKFGFKLLKEITKKEKDKNVFISPLSVSMALGMTYNGAAGSTQDDMGDVLELAGLSIGEINSSYNSLMKLFAMLDPGVRFDIANSIWYRQGLFLKEKFVALVRTYFNAKVTEMDFRDPSAPDIINKWVSENTSGRIREIVDVIDPLDAMFLINAIYFKGTWMYEFDKRLTEDDWFRMPDGSKKPIKMMRQSGEFRYFESPEFQAIDLPYGNGDFSMTIFLPHPHTDTETLITLLNEENWKRWIGSLSRQDGMLQLPKFALEYELTLNDALHSLGMGVAFDPYNADFTGMYKGSEHLFLSKVKHKTFIEVNEEGTEAAAVTSVEVKCTVALPSFSMRVDRPFVFVIRENHTQAILFMGRVAEPNLP